MARGAESEEERAAREATDWLIFLEDEPDDAELRARFARWLSAHPANRAAWTESARAYDLIGPASAQDGAAVRVFEARDVADSVAPLPSRRAMALRRLPAYGAACALAACLALVAVPRLTLWWQADYATGTGQERSVRLADGTDVALGPGSAIAVQYSGGERRVRLLKGRAFFEVTHDGAHPFVVEAHGVRTTDLGTGFEVAFGEDSTDIAVTHGAVRAEGGAAPPVSERLGAGQWARIGWSGGVQRGETTESEIAAWRRGQLIVSDRPVSEVVDQFRPYFSGIIILANARFAARHVTGVYDLRDPVGALGALAQAHEGMMVRRVTPWLVVISSR